MPHRWCDSAQIRRNQIESGVDLTFNKVFKPLFLERVLEIEHDSILEIGAGTGHLSKELAKHGCNITAIEPSNGMFQVAKNVLKGTNVSLVNCTSYDLEESNKYNVVISHLVAHVVDDIVEFFLSVSKQLKQGSHFIFSIPHPCFYNEYKNIFGSEYSYMSPVNKEISFTITKDTKNIISGVPYHHRPMSEYINSLVKSGFAVDGFDETWPTTEVQEMYGKPWVNPRYCMFICKKL